MGSALRKPATVPRKPMGIARTSTGKAAPAKKRKNPLEAAAELSEAWHGRPAKHVTEVVEKLHAHGVLAELGPMEELGIVDADNPRYEIPIKFGHDVILCSNEKGNQLFLVGGRQNVDLEEFGLEDDRDSVVIGEAASITYFASKQHLGKEDKIAGSYKHVFAEKGERPLVVYDCLNKLISLYGGTYHIDRDMDGYSAGIID